MAEFKSSVTRQETLKRFRFIVIALRGRGVLFLYESVSGMFNLYSAVATFILHSTVISGVADLFVNKNDLGRTMETLRATLPSGTFAMMHIFVRFRYYDIRELMLLTESFTWEELPTRDPETGSITMTGWIPRVQKIEKLFAYFMYFSPVIYISTRRVFLKNRPLPFNTWYPFDTSVSPTYKLINIIQMTNESISYFMFLLEDKDSIDHDKD